MSADKRVGFAGVMVPLPADKADSVNPSGAPIAESVAKGMRLERERIMRWLDWRGLTATARDVETGVQWHYDDEPDPLLNDGNACDGR